MKCGFITQHGSTWDKTTENALKSKKLCFVMPHQSPHLIWRSQYLAVICYLELEQTCSGWIWINITAEELQKLLAGIKAIHLGGEKSKILNRTHLDVFQYHLWVFFFFFFSIYYSANLVTCMKEDLWKITH